MYNYWTLVRFCGWLIFEEAMFLLKTPRRKYFFIRLAIAIGIILGGVFLINLLWGVIIWPNGLGLSIFIFAVFSVLTLVGVYLCFDVRYKDLIFIGTGAYALQHITITLISIFTYLVPVENFFVNEVLFNYLLYAVTGIVAYFTIIQRNERSKLLKDKDLVQILLAAVVLLANVYLNARMGGRGVNMTSIQVFGKVYSLLCCFLVLAIQFMSANKNKLQHEKETMDQLFHKQKEQWELTNKTIDVINIKCHDIRYMISGINDIKNSSEREKYIKELSEDITIFDSTAKTGCGPLDVVLMEKGLYCESENIKFSYMVDGEKLNFMSTVDIYILFGNAIDNAIESVCKEADLEQRIISLSVSMVGNMLFVNVENHCTTPIIFDENGMPLSDKTDSERHGFGVKSIKYIAEKYGGEVRTSAFGNRFTLNVLFPQRRDAENTLNNTT